MVQARQGLRRPAAGMWLRCQQLVQALSGSQAEAQQGLRHIHPSLHGSTDKLVLHAQLGHSALVRDVGWCMFQAGGLGGLALVQGEQSNV